jgi:GNAT superfamily N-acetyltransferase
LNSSLEIVSLDQSPELWDRILCIFFETSARTEFISSEEKETYIYQYLGYYKEKYPEFFLIGIRGDDVIGYICGSPDSRMDLELFDIIPHYKTFQDLYPEFPAHLHINLTQSSRGLGLGSYLIKSFENLCNCATHLITSPDARNREFYKKNGYLYESSRIHKMSNILFMGKSK